MKKGSFLYFGTSCDALFSHEYRSFSEGINLLTLQPYSKLQTLLAIEKLFFLRQVHGVAGVALNTVQGGSGVSASKDFEQLCSVRAVSSFAAFSCDGDYLITNVPHMGIGIMTADCLPLLLYDPVTKSIAAIHAGWRGALAGIVGRALVSMQRAYGVEPQMVQAYIGPCIHPCCYQVGEQVVQALDAYSVPDCHSCCQSSLDMHRSSLATVLHQRQGSFYFDLPGFVAQQLYAAGLKKEAISREHTCCTYCTPGYWSYRRQGEKAGRQMSVISLNL
ncbi:polyphenol oxidase family protein [Methylicorpusculum sp.]|uniref:polyphenol oxidase family protein n=1 Tax=Methylicorpusculum sp. TaxID=2713644 RepID=UPI002AB98E3E|nr:polyphenol oxidase family protein [Methylicorpusculum sp.]MDZ4151707.1 polyphenol oxidase family protein [Methylicorpusculum sp.]